MVGDSLQGPKALGAFLRAHREQLAPEKVGIPVSGRRRTRGLRREELAQMSRISTTWYTWIEQGRDVSVSPSALSRLAQALQLTPAARDYLFNLAELKDPQKLHEITPLDRLAVAALQHMDCPAYLLDGCWQMLAWNAQAAALFQGWLEVDPQPNLLRFMFLNPLAKQRVVDWPERAQRVVAEFRAESSHYAPAEQARQLVMTLCRDSREFERWWTQQSVLAREGGERRFCHPDGGEVIYQQHTLHPAANHECKLVMLIPR